MNGVLPAPIAAFVSHPIVIGAIILLTIVALVRGWWPVLLVVLLVALAQGLHYLLRHSALGPEFNRGVVIGVYAFGGILFVFLALAHFFTRDS
jgi:hypothetical protein